MTRRPKPPTSPTRDRARARAPRQEWPDRQAEPPLASWFNEDRPGDEGGWGHVSDLGISRSDTDRGQPRQPRR
jgi:hypothetical protein